MKKERPLYTSVDNLPLSLMADDVAAILNISRTRVYSEGTNTSKKHI